MIRKETSSENPNEHWEFIECNNNVAIDLGCGRWETVEYRNPSWPTTPEWLLLKGASEVHAYDIDDKEVYWYNNTLGNKKITAYTKSITTIADLRAILEAHKPKIVKCDIEGYETLFLELSDDEFTSIDFYALETHSDKLYDAFVTKFKALNYEIIAVVDLVHAPPMKALFAKNKNNIVTKL